MRKFAAVHNLFLRTIGPTFFHSIPALSVSVGCCISSKEPQLSAREKSKPRSASVALPEFCRPQDRAFFEKIQTLYLPGTFTLNLLEGRVLNDGVVLTKEGKILREVCVAHGYSSSNHPYEGRRIFALTRKLKGRIAVIASRGAECYYHWVFDVLPRLGLIEDQTREGLLVENAFGFQQNSLELLGCKDVISCGQGYHFQCEDLLVPSLPGISGIPTPESCQWLRSRFANEEKSSGRRIYISREDSSKRRVVNEKELLSMLLPLGFEKHVLSGMTFADQVRLFQSASIVIAPHGASLTNVVFCQPGTVVIELSNPSYVHWCYWYICACNGLRYACLVPPDAPPVSHKREFSNAAIYVDLGVVEQTLNSIQNAY